MKNKRLSPKANDVLKRMEREFPIILKQFPHKWKQDLALGFGLGAGLDYDEANELRATAADNDFWV